MSRIYEEKEFCPECKSEVNFIIKIDSIDFNKCSYCGLIYRRRNG